MCAQWLTSAPLHSNRNPPGLMTFSLTALVKERKPVIFGKGGVPVRLLIGFDI